MEKIYETEFGCVDWDVYSDPVFDDEGNESEGEEYVKIDNLFVSPEYRGQGHARELMLHAIAQIEKDFPGLEIMIVPVPKDETTDFNKLSSFYEDLGLTVIAY